MQVVNTIQFIGELKYRLKNEVCVDYVMITRGQVKKWVFDNYQEDCMELIDKKISYMDEYGEKKNTMLEVTGKKAKYRRYKTKDGSLRKATFHWIDDRIVIRVMKKFWKIPEAKKFKKNEHGFKDHSWQALSLIAYYMSTTKQSYNNDIQGYDYKQNHHRNHEYLN
jgi:hypothetical protein